MPQPRPADIRALVRRLQGGSAAEQVQAATALFQMIDSNHGRHEAIAAMVADAGGIPVLLQLIGSQGGEHPVAALAFSLLFFMTCNSPARCQAVIAGDGIGPLVRCLESSSSNATMQAVATRALATIAAYGGEAGQSAAAAAVAIPAAIRRLSSRDEWVLEGVALLLGNLAASHQRNCAIAAAGGIPPLVRLLRRPNPLILLGSARTLAKLTEPPGSPERNAAVKRRAASLCSCSCSAPAAMPAL